MNQYLAAFALFAALAQPATAITFPGLTTIYVGSGVKDSGSGANAGTATVFHCTNVSGLAASVRALTLLPNGTVAGSTTVNVAHGATATLSTHGTFFFNETSVTSPGIAISEGGVNIEATESGVFCNSKVIDASVSLPSGYGLPLVRVNPHPGTVE